jgi:Osmosensitive K+ channel histidine kinase
MQLHRVNLSIASPSEIERTARQLMAAREDFLRAGNPALWSPRPLILDSWQRCRTLQINPSLRYAPLAAVRETQLDQLREANALLVQAAQPVMKQLGEFLGNSGYAIALTDAQGYLLEVFGKAAILRRLERTDFVPGGNMGETAAGTNAIGTALADGHTVQLMAAEHYCDAWQDLTCTATPIRHPLTDEVIGALDMTGDYRLVRPFFTCLLVNAALEIRQRLSPFFSPSIYRGALHQTYTTPASQWGEFQTRTATVKARDLSVLNAGRISNNTPRTDFQERRAGEAERLGSVGIISASLDLDVTIEKVIEQVTHLLQVERAGIFLFNKEGEIASLYGRTASLSSQPEYAQILSTELKGSGAITLIQERSEPVVIHDALKSPLMPQSLVARTGIRALLLLPLLTARGVGGCIALSRMLPYTWTIAEIRLGLAIATQSATAIENARLFDELQQHNRHIEALNAITQIFNTLPDPSHHLDLALQQITEILNVDAGMILLREQESPTLTLAAHCNFPVSIPCDAGTGYWHALQRLALRVIAECEPMVVNRDDHLELLTDQTLLKLGFASLTVVPLASGDDNLGVLFIGQCDSHGRPQENRQFFSTIGQQIGLALRNAQLRRSASEMEALREADHLKSSFLAAVSHDLRSPLTAIRASVESLLDTESLQSAMGQEDLLQTIASQTSRLGRLVDQLLDLSEIEAGTLPFDRDWIDLSIAIEDIIKDFERLHPGHCIEREVSANLPLLYIDANRLAQVLWNLLENAAKYAPLDTPIQVKAYPQGSEMWMSVADRGPGIPAGEQEKIFQRFYRLEREQRTHIKGSGLGLAICKGIVETHGGRIWVENRVGGGCTFQIALQVPSESGSVGIEELEDHF